MENIINKGMPQYLYECFSIVNRFSGNIDIVPLDYIIPAPDGVCITVAQRKFEVLGYYFDDSGRKLPVWGFEYPQSELKKLVREDRRMHRKAKRK